MVDTPDIWTPLIIVHALAASYSVLLGLVQLVRRKGDRPHRLLGRIWVGAMVFTCVSSFGILSAGSFSPLHALAAWTLFTVVFGLVMAQRGRIRIHACFMAASYLGLLGALVGVIALPSRRVPQLAIHQPVLFGVWLLIVAASVACVVFGTVTAGKREKLSPEGPPQQQHRHAPNVSTRKEP